MTVDTAISDVDATALEGTVSTDFSMIGLFLQADIIVKLVMLTLLFASVWSWSIILHKRGTIKKLNNRANRFEDAFWSGESLDKLYDRVKKSPDDPVLKTFSAGMDEWRLGVRNGVPASDGMQASLKQRIERAMSITIAREMTRLEKGMTFLASIGATAPFIGLFGTVWGIMNSFSAIAGSQNTSLVVVAPGIAEALFATALGLVAAIPAVVAYNIFSTELNRYADRLENFLIEFSTILARHLDGQEGGEAMAQKKMTAQGGRFSPKAA